MWLGFGKSLLALKKWRGLIEKTFQKVGSRQHHTYQPLFFAIVVDIKKLEVMVPNLPGSGDLTVWQGRGDLLMKEIVSCCKNIL